MAEKQNLYTLFGLDKGALSHNYRESQDADGVDDIVIYGLPQSFDKTTLGHLVRLDAAVRGKALPDSLYASVEESNDLISVHILFASPVNCDLIMEVVSDNVDNMLEDLSHPVDQTVIRCERTNRYVVLLDSLRKNGPAPESPHP